MLWEDLPQTRRQWSRELNPDNNLTPKLVLLAVLFLFLMLWAVMLASHGWEMRWWRAGEGSDLVSSHDRGSSYYHHQGDVSC